MSATHLAYTVDAATPRVLVFGHKGSGKSYLLGALYQAGEKQGELLGAEVEDLSLPPRLALIRDAVYYNTDFVQSQTELIHTPIRLRPWRGGAWAGGPGVVELLDCDGQAAKSVMAGADRLRDRDVRGTLAAAVVRADVIVLVVNAGAGEKDLGRQFDDFLFFLQEVARRKEFRREVGGFPVALVLTQCDGLAKPGESRAEWEVRVERRREHVVAKFEDYLRDASPEPGIQSPYLPFGRVDLTDYAVAVRWPKLRDVEHPPDEPYRVAELFREVFAAAAAHRKRVKSSDRRLKTTVWAVLCTLWVLVAAAMVVGYFQPQAADPGLADRVRAYWEQDPPAAVRLSDRNIARTKRTLTNFHADPGFFSLPEDLQRFVTGRLREVEDYQAYKAKLLAASAPADARTLDDLARAETVLTTDLALPAEYTWADTEAGRLRDKWLADVPLIRKAELGWYDWFQGLIGRAVNLSLTRGFDDDWRARVGDLLADARKPIDLGAQLPESAEVPQPRGGAVTERVPYEYDRVYQARREWEFARERLLHLRDLADALALTPDPGDPARRALFIPPPGPKSEADELPGVRLAALRKEYPPRTDIYAISDHPVKATYPEWELANFPEPGRSVLAARARESFANGVGHARGLIRGRLPADTPEGWAKVAAGLGDRPFPQWGELLRVLARLEKPAAPDPVAELAAFLRAKEFAFDLIGVEVAIPLALRVPQVVPAGPLTITVTPAAGGDPVKSTFRPAGDGTQQGQSVLTRFTPDGAGSFVVRPGDGLRAELPVRSGDQRFTLVWDEGGPKTYPLGRLAREPKLVREGAPPEPATGVVLTPAAGSVVPRVPVLLPDDLR
ncbi:MAG: hypothetical protein K2X82_07195 [Gemmataceae bacterium]|nr:hypothetical protein [Gemmataceae bacterium]